MEFLPCGLSGPAVICLLALSFFSLRFGMPSIFFFFSAELYLSPHGGGPFYFELLLSILRICVTSGLSSHSLDYFFMEVEIPDFLVFTGWRTLLTSPTLLSSHPWFFFFVNSFLPPFLEMDCASTSKAPDLVQRPL